MSVSSREVALKATSAMRRRGIRIDLFLNDQILHSHLDTRDGALARKIAMGVQQNLLLCDYIIEQNSNRRLSKLDPVILDILRISVYQLLFLTKIPVSAIVNEAVKLTKKYSNVGASGFVNAVLRSISVQSDKILNIQCDTIYKTLSIRYSHPEWMVRYILDAFSKEFCMDFLASNNMEIPMVAQTNLLKVQRDEILTILREEGATVLEDENNSSAFYISGIGNIASLSAFQKGLFYIQDNAAYMAVLASGVEPGMFVLDGCAAPGGKSFAAAILMHNRGHILSCDIQEKKLRLIQEGSKRLGIQIIDTKCQDGRIFDKSLAGKVDIVLADVPCSGLGVIRKKPDVRYKTQEEISGLPKIQSDILSNLAKNVKPGGVLLYSTCTILKEENEAVVQEFVRKNPDFSFEAFLLPLPVGAVKSGMITLYPNVHGTDGFFICKLRRKSDV